MLSSRFQIRAPLAAQKTSTKATAVGLSQAAAAKDQQLQEDLVGEIKIPQPDKTLSTSQSHRASSWSEEQDTGWMPKRQSPGGAGRGHVVGTAARASSSTQHGLFPHPRGDLGMSLVHKSPTSCPTATYLRQSNAERAREVPIQLSQQLNYLQWNCNAGQRDKVKS